MRAIVTRLCSLVIYDRDIAGRAVLQHLSGHLNLAADWVCRALWEALFEFCNDLRITLTLVTLTEEEQSFLHEVITEAAYRKLGDTQEVKDRLDRELELLRDYQRRFQQSGTRPAPHEPTRNQPLEFDERGMENIQLLPLAMDSDNGIIPGPPWWSEPCVDQAFKPPSAQLRRWRSRHGGPGTHNGTYPHWR